DGGDEFVSAEIDSKALRIGDVALGGRREIAQHGPVLGCDLPKILGADQAGGSSHVLHDDVRAACDMPSNMTCKNTGLDIGRPTRVIVDEYSELLARVVALRASVGDQRHKEGGERGQETVYLMHGAPGEMCLPRMVVYCGRSLKATRTPAF